MTESPLVLLSLGILLLVATYQRWRIRRQLFRMTEKMDGILRAQGLTSIDFLRAPAIRKHLPLKQITNRLEQRIDKLAAAKAETKNQRRENNADT